jgi:hypothetical protein
MSLHRIEFYIETHATTVHVAAIAESLDGTRKRVALIGTPDTFDECVEVIESIARRYCMP